LADIVVDIIFYEKSIPARRLRRRTSIYLARQNYSR
jgi:hypothetical protein